MNHRLRKAVTALAIGNLGKRGQAATGGHGGDGDTTGGCCDANHATFFPFEVANRPGRIEPRVIKRQRHRYQLMKQPKAQIRQSSATSKA